ncbi:MAG: hypothetical protein IJM22_07290, partial [Treponema sp.]|nr:hypothetical protein [Treponema sp.]
MKKVNVIKSDKQSFNFEFDHNLTPELIAEGQARELIRTINSERKSRQLANQDAWEYQLEN